MYIEWHTLQKEKYDTVSDDRDTADEMRKDEKALEKALATPSSSVRDEKYNVTSLVNASHAPAPVRHVPPTSR